MKLLFDENLSRKLVQRLADLYPGSAHVVDVDLMKSPDLSIWNFAKITRDAERVLRREAIRIADFVENPELAVLIVAREA